MTASEARVTTIGVQLPADLADAMKECAQKAERSLSAEVRIALREYLAAQEKAA